MHHKKFALGIGLVLSFLMFVLMVVLNTFSVITGITCLICLILMFFETAFGICIGCKLYSLFNKGKGNIVLVKFVMSKQTRNQK